MTISPQIYLKIQKNLLFKSTVLFTQCFKNDQRKVQLHSNNSRHEAVLQWIQIHHQMNEQELDEEVSAILARDRRYNRCA